MAWSPSRDIHSSQTDSRLQTTLLEDHQCIQVYRREESGVNLV